MKNAWLALLAMVVCACSGGDSFEYDEDGNVIQELQQPLITQVSSKNESQCNMISGVMFEEAPLGGLSYGAVSCMAADKDIYVPRTRTVSLKPSNSSCTTAQYNAMVAQLDLIIAELNTPASLGGVWTFSKSTTGTHPVTCVSLPASAVGPNSIRNFVRVVPTFDSSATIFDNDSVADGAGFLPWSKLTIQIDAADVFAKGSTAAADTRILWHAVAHGVEKLTGTGEYAGNRMTASDTDVSESAGRVMFSVGERCRARNYSTTQTSNMFWSTSAACANN